MGLNFDRPQAGVQTAVLEAENGVEVVEKYDIVADRQQMNTALTGSRSMIWRRSFLSEQRWQRKSPRLPMWF